MRNLLRKRMKRVALFIVIVLACGNPAAANLCDFEGEKVAANQELDTMRGGFDFADGLQVSIGIMRDVLLNGVRQMGSQLYIPNLAQPNNAQPVVTIINPTVGQSADATTTLVNTNTPVASTTKSDNPVAATGNSASPTVVINSTQTEVGTLVQKFGDPIGPIVVQNTMDGAVIQNNTSIDITTNSASMNRVINLSTSISQQMVNAIR